MNYHYALAIAEETMDTLHPYCRRIAIAGSIRRLKPEPNDIEIVAIPHPYETGLFESGIAIVVNKWKKLKGSLPCKYTQRMLPQGIKLDLFLATPENWGLIFAIRTGSAQYVHQVLAKEWVRQGYYSHQGMLMRKNKPVPIPEEEDLFSLLHISCPDPELRELTQKHNP